MSGTADAFCGCGAGLASDQRYCLRCGAPTGLADARRAGLFGGEVQSTPRGSDVAGFGVAGEQLTPPRSNVAGFAVARRASRVRLPGLGAELPIGGATAIFALVLGTSAWAGARATSPPLPIGPAYAYAAAPAGGSGAAPLAPPTLLTPADDLAGDAASVALADDTLGDSAIAGTTAGSDSTTNSTDSTEAAGDGDDASGDGDEPAADTAQTPTLERVVVISLPELPYDALGDPAGPAPYLSGEVVSSGAFLRSFSATSSSPLASRIALLSGQAPNARTREACSTVDPLTPGTVGDDEQAAGDGCLYSADVFTAGDLLAASDRGWRIYSDASAADCAPLAAGSPWPAGRPAPLAFGTVTSAADCATRLAPTSQLATDLGAKDAPALSYVELAAGSPSDVDAALRELLPKLSEALKPVENAAILIVPSATPEAGDATDRSACCSRPWVTDQATGGGGRTGAVLISPLAKAGSVLDEPLDHFDVLKTVSQSLGIRPLGYAGRDEVKGLPREAWGNWKGAAATDPTQSAG